MVNYAKIESIRYRCSRCDELHKGLPELAFTLPAVIAEIDEGERESRCHISDDFCVLDEQHYFVRGVLLLPILGLGTSYGIGGWSTLSKDNFGLYWKHFHDPDQARLGPFFGWLSNDVPKFDGTRNLKCQVSLRNEGLRPTLELQPTDHPLAQAQRDGIEIARVIELAQEIPGIKFIVQ